MSPFKLVLGFCLFFASSVQAQEALSEPPMTLERMLDIFTVLDPETQSNGTQFHLTVEDVPILVFTDVQADRMRAMIPIRSCLLYTSPSPRDQRGSRMPSSA